MQLGQSHHLSILLEIIAFFMVTLDLYGRRHLRASSRALEKVLAYLRQRFENGLSTALTIAALSLVFLFIANAIEPKPLHDDGWSASEISFLAVAALAVLPWLAAGVLFVVWSTTAAGLALVNKVQLRGVMLVIGALLFIISKAILW